MKRRFFLTPVLWTALVLSLAGMASAQQMPPTLVEIDSVRSLEFHEQITLIGRTEAKIESRLVAEVSGQVEEINVGEGTWVAAGDVLLTIDPESPRLLLEAKTAEVTEARVQVDLATLSWERTRDLFAQELVHEFSRDSARAWLTITKARRQKLAAERDRLALDLRNCRVKAPFAGYTIRRLVNIGEWVDPGTPVFELVDLSALIVRVDLPERHYGRLLPGSAVRVVVSGDEAAPLSGAVTGFGPRASEETHTYPVVVTVANPAGRVGGGALVRATLSLDQQFTSLAVSKDAIVRQGAQTMVYTIRDSQAAPLPVMITSEKETMVAIAGQGIAEGMPVVVRGNERIFPGSPVRIAGEPPPGAGNPPPADDGPPPAEAETP